MRFITSLLPEEHTSKVKPSSPDGIVISTGIQKHVNECINKSKGCDGSGSGGRLNCPLALLEIKTKQNKTPLQCDELSPSLYSYVSLTQSDLNPKTVF